MIQNAHDVDAKSITIDIEKDKLTFSHDSGSFTPKELVSLLGMSLTTKSGDVSTIGKFGIGFKYWYLHFKELSIHYCEDGVRHTHRVAPRILPGGVILLVLRGRLRKNHTVPILLSERSSTMGGLLDRGPVRDEANK